MDNTYAYAGNELVGKELGARLAAAGFEQISDVADASFVVTYCTSSTALEDVYFDERGIVQTARPGATLIDLSAATPSFARELNAVAVVSDLAPVEAPLVVADITDSHAFSQASNLMCFVSGDEAAIAAARPLIDAIAGTVEVMGGAGAAQLARAAYTIQTTAQVMAAIEADALYRAQQRSSSTLESVAAQRVGAIAPQAERVLTAVNERRFEGDYTVEMFMAELSAALMAADDIDLILPQAEACLHLLELLAVIGGAEKAPASLALVYGEEAACAQAGLDWTRAEQAYGEGYAVHDHDHDHDHETEAYGYDEPFDEADYDYNGYSEGSYPAGFGAN